MGSHKTTMKWLFCAGFLSLTHCGSDPAATDAGVQTQADAGPNAPVPSMVPMSLTGHDRFYGVSFDTQGRIYAVGNIADSTETTANYRVLVARFTPTGDRDPSFGTNGMASHDIVVGTNGETSRSVVVQSSGKVVALATVEHPGAADARDRDIALVRFNSDGSLDTSFGTNGVVTFDLSTGVAVGSSFIADSAWGLARYDNDRLLITGSQKRQGGNDSDFVVMRVSADGVRDNTFGTDGVVTVDINNRNASPRASTILPDGSTVTAGYMEDGGVVKPVLFKLTPAGALDTTFGQQGIAAPAVLGATTEAYGAALQGDSLVTTGYGRNDATESLDWVSLRFTAAGVLDTRYGTQGHTRIDVAGFNDNSRGLIVLPDQRVLLVGGGRTTETNSDAMVAILTRDGQLDTSFAPRGYRTYDLGGTGDFFWGVALSPTRDRVVAVGARSGVTGGHDDAAVIVIPL